VVPAPGDGDFAHDVSAAVADLIDSGIQPAALIVDTIFASDGVRPEVPGFADAVDTVRTAGGLFIADEVQPGFGRLGTGMWGFARHDLLPDLVTLGKPMGNGHPVAAVIARPDLLAAFGRQVRYFNTFGGSSVSIAAAQATLDVLRDENLVENARVVGEYLMEQLPGIAGVVEVRGSGLFIGVRVAGEHVALGAVNDLKRRHILLGESGRDNDVLKIRPPLVFSRADADRLLEGLEAVLA
jgi:4-aminobutyrate aminotransferase-like enzyme